MQYRLEYLIKKQTIIQDFPNPPKNCIISKNEFGWPILHSLDNGKQFFAFIGEENAFSNFFYAPIFYRGL